MALDRMNAEYTYRSGSGGVYYYFIVGVDSGDRISVRNIQTPQGRTLDSSTGLPQAVTDDIQTAIGQVRNFVAQSSSVNGQLSFVAATSAAVVFATPMASTTYRVVFSTVDFLPVRVTSKTTAGFTVETGVTYTGTVGYDVFV